MKSGGSEIGGDSDFVYCFLLTPIDRLKTRGLNHLLPFINMPLHYPFQGSCLLKLWRLHSVFLKHSLYCVLSRASYSAIPLTPPLVISLSVKSDSLPVDDSVVLVFLGSIKLLSLRRHEPRSYCPRSFHYKGTGVTPKRDVRTTWYVPVTPPSNLPCP